MVYVLCMLVGVSGVICCVYVCICLCVGHGWEYEQSFRVPAGTCAYSGCVACAPTCLTQLPSLLLPLLAITPACRCHFHLKLRQVMDFLGSAAFSQAVQALDVATGALVCLKIIKNNKVRSVAASQFCVGRWACAFVYSKCLPACACVRNVALTCFACSLHTSHPPQSSHLPHDIHHPPATDTTNIIRTTLTSPLMR